MVPRTSGYPPSRRRPTVAIVGATGAVGTEMVRCLEARGFPLAALRLFASARSAGKIVAACGTRTIVAPLADDAFAGVDIALFAAGSDVARRYAPAAVKRGAVVIDNSSAFRRDAAVPLVVPEINAAAIARHRGIIANPNCVAIIALMPLWPIH
ncbi:MAG TPA: aspartate-semialdehyde dehydrogenase, partial [Stellaceae bacterium]|nr:aspartate-semialdehyde dehydrogenase [Stellaceae bacterium]